jgi:hypothetical protein
MSAGGSGPGRGDADGCDHRRCRDHGGRREQETGSAFTEHNGQALSVGGRLILTLAQQRNKLLSLITNLFHSAVLSAFADR